MLEKLKDSFYLFLTFLVHVVLNTLSLPSITLDYTESQTLMYSHCFLTTGCGGIPRVGAYVYRLSQEISKRGAVSGALYQGLKVHSDNF